MPSPWNLPAAVDPVMHPERVAWWYVSALLASIGLITTMAIVKSSAIWPTLLVLTALIYFVIVFGHTIYGYGTDTFLDSLRAHINLIIKPKYQHVRWKAVEALYYSFAVPFYCVVLIIIGVRRHIKTAVQRAT